MNVASQLEAVTVYARGAVCTRVAKVSGATGRVRIIGLPLSLAPGSLRARVVAGTARVLDVRPGYEVELKGEADLSAEVKAHEAAVAEQARLERAQARVQQEIGELQHVKPTFPPTRAGEPPRSAPVEALLKAAEFVSQELEKRFASRRALEQQLKDARHEVELKLKRVHEASSAGRAQRARLTRAAVVTLSEAAGELELAIEYFVAGARWVPSYALSLSPNLGDGVLSLRAAVAQSTGEDWSQVKLSLSTAALDRRTALPELKSLRIGRAQPPPQRSGWREPPPGLDELFAGFDAAWAERPRPPPAPKPQAPVGAPPQSSRASMKEQARQAPAAAAPAMTAAFAAPPPMPAPMSNSAPGAPPPIRAQPMMARARMSAKKSAGLLGGFGGSGAPADADEASLDEAAPEEARALAAEPAPAPQLEPGEALLDYGSLYLEEPGPGRGRLVTGTDPAIAFAMSLRIEVSQVLVLVESSQRAAAQIDQLPLPPRTSTPSAGSFDYRYDCAARVDVPSKPAWTVVPVTDAEVGLQAAYACVPSVEPQVYRTVKVHNRSKHALLRGPVDVTLGDEFLLTADLPLIAPGSRVAQLGLGVEEAIKVARKTHFKETPGGLLGGSTLLPHDVEIELSNRLQFPAQVEIRERVPVSSDDDVKIEEAKVEPAWEKDEAPRDGEAAVRGARVWRVTVPASAKLNLYAQVVVRIPSDQMLVGGNRRS
ncbi:MAG: DUF4139 domain-containing protein [Archangiaceae bacterium]|nr:DUF4139 domain-containing protein [Archangiaceae bacterium]